MNKPERFKQAIAALRYAYFTNTLQSLSCTSCAVGNIVGYANNNNKPILGSIVRLLAENGQTVNHCNWDAVTRGFVL